MTKPPVHYRRVFPRFSVALRVEVEFKELKLPIRAHTLNISSGGMFVAMRDYAPSKDAECSFKLFYEGSSDAPLKGSGVVRWTSGEQYGRQRGGAGIEFISSVENERGLDITTVLNELTAIG